MLTPSDRSNFSGPWFMPAWDYPGVYNVPGANGAFAYVGPRGTEEVGREVGTVVWGDINKGKFKYYAGIMDLDNAPTNTPLYPGRLQYAFLGSEPGFYGAAPTTALRTSSLSVSRRSTKSVSPSARSRTTSFSSTPTFSPSSTSVNPALSA